MKSMIWKNVAIATLALGGAAAPAALAQTAPVQAQPSAPIPSEVELAKMVWTTMIAVDQANKAGNYSVLRDLAAPGFQAANDNARLTQIFAQLRASNVDLSNTLLTVPSYRSRPAMVQPDMLRATGFFPLRPTAIEFDLVYQWAGDRWRLFGVAVAPFQLLQPAEQPAAAPQPPARRRGQ